MIQLSEEQLKEIYQAITIDTSNVYIDRQTEKIYIVPTDENKEFNIEAWDFYQSTILINEKNYIEISPMLNRKCLNILEDFAEICQRPKLQQYLFKALNSKHPFSNFKYYLAKNPNEEKNFYAFKYERYVNYIKKHLQYDSEED